MVSAFASQLQAIASKSSNELDLKARRTAHAESILFEKDVAVKQDFETIYNICIEGFNELCHLDSRFHDFDANLFAEQAKSQDREELTESENAALDVVLKRCLMLLGGRILLKPALRALEWLIRRFRVHIYNVDDLLHTLLPYHEVSVWANVLSIVPGTKIVGQWKFVRPYLKTTWNIPRHAIAYAASNNDSVFASLNSYTLELCRQDLNHTLYMRFWSGIIVESVSSRLAQTRSGRKEVQMQRMEDLLLKTLPLLSEGYEVSGSIDLITTCYTLTVVLAAKAELGDHVLDSLLLAVCQSFQHITQTLSAGLTTLAVLVSSKENLVLPKRVLSTLSSMENFASLVREIAKKQSCLRLLTALIRSSMSHIRRKNAKQLTMFTSSLVGLMEELYPNHLIDSAVAPVVSKLLLTAAVTDDTIDVRNELVALLQELNRTSSMSAVVRQAVITAKLDANLLENLLGMTMELAPLESQQDDDDDILMNDALVAPADSSRPLEELLHLTRQKDFSFLAAGSSESFRQISAIFEACASDPEKLRSFTAATMWSNTTSGTLLWQTFLIRFACSNYVAQMRQKALQMLNESLKEKLICDIQLFIPYLLVLLTDVKALRQSASNTLDGLRDLSSHGSLKVTGQSLYDIEAARNVVLLPQKQVLSILTDVICPVTEECVLDPTHIIKVIQNSLQANTATDVKKSHRQALFTLLTQHALATPLMRLKVVTISMLSGAERVGGKSKTKLLLPILQAWSTVTIESANQVSRECGLSTEEIDGACVQLTDVHDGNYLDQISQAAKSSDPIMRTGLIQALFEHMRRNWNSWTPEESLSAAGTLFNIAFATNEVLSTSAQDVLRSVDLSSEVLATLLQLSEDGSSTVKGPPSKKKRRSSSGASQSRIEVMKTIDDTTAKISFTLELVDSNSPELKPELVTVMFEMLTCLKQLQQNRVESPYLLNLCLSSIYAMIQSLSTREKSADLSGLRPELVTECLRSSDNPQVQNTSLLVIAALSSVVPDRMVHNVMPIFTFIGHNMLSKDDEHSINVVNEAIDRIVPALLQNLRKGKNVQAYQSSMSTMLASFTSAYEHISRQRRVAFYQKLLSCIDAAEFGFVLVSLLAAQEGKTDSFKKFLEDLTSALPPASQLMIYQKLILLAVDVLSASPKIATNVYNLGKTSPTKERDLYAGSNLTAATVILQSQHLTSAVRTLSRLEPSHAQQIKELLRTSFEITLTAIRDIKSASQAIGVLARQSLDALLQLPTVVDLLEMLETTLDNMEPTQLRPQALRVLSLQLQGKQKKNTRGRESALSLVQKLNGYVDPEHDVALVQASLACLNCIAEVYGRKDPETITSVAENIAKHGLMTFKPYPRVLEAAILTIASVVEVVKEGIVPLVSDIISQTLSVVGDAVKEPLSSSCYHATCTLLTAILSNAAFVLSGDQVVQILSTMIPAKEIFIGPQEDSDLSLLIRSIAQKVELEIIIEASASFVKSQANTQETMIATILHMLGQAIEVSPKTAVIRQAEAVSRLFETVLEARATAISDDSNRQERGEASSLLLEQLKVTSVKFVYRINDTTFRPIFESWVDWASLSSHTDTVNSPVTQSSRHTVLFELLAHFFETLKAIVTSYATYLLTPISTILKAANSPNMSARPKETLLINTLTLLRTIAIHDQDSFFSAPSHFEPIAEPLITILNLASMKSTRPFISSHIIPTIIGLATATVDSPATHSSLAHFIVGLKSHNSAHVRLASIRTLLALTEDEDLGDDFIANTIGIGAGEGEGARGGGSSVGEIMVYVNEMLEDDDEDVEREVRRWVQVVRGKVGEDVFEI